MLARKNENWGSDYKKPKMPRKGLSLFLWAMESNRISAAGDLLNSCFNKNNLGAKWRYGEWCNMPPRSHLKNEGLGMELWGMPSAPSGDSLS